MAVGIGSSGSCSVLYWPMTFHGGNCPIYRIYKKSFSATPFSTPFSMTETRVLRITKEAMKGTSRSTRKTKSQRGGYDDPPPPFTPTTTLPPQAPLMAAQQQPPPLIAVTPSSPASASAAAPRGGVRKLHLAPKKEKLALVKPKRSQTRKVVRIQMGHLRKSMKRAKDIVTESSEKPIKEIEEILVTAGIIRKREGAMSEGKQKTLRGIYRDYLQLRLNAL